LDAKALEALAGQYSAGFVNVNIIKNGDKLWVEMPNQPKIELLPEAENKFYVREVEGYVTFVKNDKGEVAEAVIEMGGRTIRAKRKTDENTGGK
jgi:hypothetical protein